MGRRPGDPSDQSADVAGQRSGGCIANGSCKPPDELLGVDFAAVAKDRLYRCLDRLAAHKDALHRHLVERWRTLFDAKFDVLLYDLTSTYFEGLGEQNPRPSTATAATAGRTAAGGDRVDRHAGRAAVVL